MKKASGELVLQKRQMPKVSDNPPIPILHPPMLPALTCQSNASLRTQPERFRNTCIQVQHNETHHSYQQAVSPREWDNPCGEALRVPRL